MKRQLLGVFAATAISQLVAFFKLWLVARYFGVGTELDGYNLAFVVPSLISGVMFAAVQTGLFPVYSSFRLREGDSAAHAFARGILAGLFVLGVALSLIVFAMADVIAGWLAGAGGPPLLQATAHVLRFAAFAIALNAVGDFLGSMLALQGRFLTAAAAPIANGLVGAVLLIAWPEGRLTNLALGTLLGVALQLAIALGASTAAGFSPFGSLSRARTISSDAAEIFRLGAWIIPGMVCSGIIGTLPPVLLVPFGEGAVSAFGYAFRFHQTAIQLIVMAVSPILLSRFSELVARGESVALERMRLTALRASLGLGAAALAAVLLFGEPLLVLILGHGRFDAAAANRVAAHWAWLTLGLSASIYGTVLAKRLQAGRYAAQLSVFAFASLVSFVGVAAAMRLFIGEWAISIAVAAGALVPAFLMHAYISRKK